MAQRREHGVDLDLYLSGYPKEKLSREEEQRIGGLPFGHVDRWKLVQHNMRFAVKWCFSLYYKNKLVNDFEALLAAAEDSLIHVAIKKYKATGTPFVSYASYYLNRDTNREVNRQICIVKLPEYRVGNPDGLKEDGKYHAPVDTSDDHTGVLGVTESSDAQLEHIELRKAIIEEINRLITSEYERKVFMMAHGLDGGEPMNNVEISEQLGVTRQAISKTMLKCRRKLGKSRILKELAST